jgi:threonine/homoserine/homoserine lactone efflux protein
MEILLSLTSFALATACTPGPNNIMLTASGVNFGFARSIPHMTGVVVGFIILLAACAGGLGLLFAAFPAAHTALKVAGGAYLLWLAWKVASAGRPQRTDDESARPLTFLQAAAFQWVNPKGVLTALSAVALFVRPPSARTDTALMLMVFAFATVIAVTVWTAFGTVVSRALRDPRHARIFNIVMALLLVASIVPMVI